MDFDDDATPLHENVRRMSEGDAPHYAADDWHERNGFGLAHESSHVRCMCGVRVADEVELRVHQHYDHGITMAAVA